VKQCGAIGADQNTSNVTIGGVSLSKMFHVKHHTGVDTGWSYLGGDSRPDIRPHCFT